MSMAQSPVLTFETARRLLSIFVAWKALLLVVALLSPGPGYDTSTSLFQVLAVTETGRRGDGSDGFLSWLIAELSLKLTRWDAIYFTAAATRGKIFEQEWAFSWEFSRLISGVAHGFQRLGCPDEFAASLAGIVIAHVSHGLSVLALYALVAKLASSHRIAFTAASLHVFAPAGLFLSAPYAESTFALFSFSGMALLTQRFRAKAEPSMTDDISVVLAGVLLGLATAVRSNGLLGGILFLEEAVRTLSKLRSKLASALIRHLAAVGLGGVCIGLGFLVPQALAYQQFCQADSSDSTTPWCKQTIPLIYTYVQEHYWNVGFLRYWTISNLPLFILATPVLTAMIYSSWWILTRQEADDKSVQFDPLIYSMAAVQMILALLAITSYHVQIITRVASAYPVTYIWLATTLASTDGISTRVVKFGSTFMVMYALIQGGLFASFLPPA